VCGEQWTLFVLKAALYSLTTPVLSDDSSDEDGKLESLDSESDIAQTVEWVWVVWRWCCFEAFVLFCSVV
jgi:hypothetical protein